MKKVLLCIALGAAAVLGASAATSAQPRSTAQEFSLLEIAGPSKGLGGFHFQHEPRAGDQTAQTDRLYKWVDGKRGTRVGRVEMIFTTKTDFTRKGATGLVTAQAFLPGGSLFVQGYAHFGPSDPPTAFPILGGTGTFATARGYVVSRQSGDDSTKLEFHLA